MPAIAIISGIAQVLALCAALFLSAAISYSDIKHLKIPNRFLRLALLLNIFMTLVFLLDAAVTWIFIAQAVIVVLIAGLVLIKLRAVLKRYGGFLGWGDIKLLPLALLSGTIFSRTQIVLEYVLVCAVLILLSFAVQKILRKTAEYLPLAPAIIAAAWITAAAQVFSV